MALDPRRFTVRNCPQSQNTLIIQDAERREFFDSLGKIGNIEVANRLGAGNITAGLRTLAQTSNSIRTGDVDSAIIPNSAGYVFATVGIDNNAAQQAGEFNPGVLNRATGQAESIISDVRSGRFDFNDIPTVVSELQNLNTLIGGIQNSGDGEENTTSREICGASPYAIDLIQYAPKYKFLFIVQITLSPAYQGGLADSANRLAFVVKTSTRPQVNIEHEEINLYNFWTRIPKRAVYEPITMRFYDDNQGLAHLFYTAYLESISPVARSFTREQISSAGGTEWLQANSMAFNSINSIGSASISALEGGAVSIISQIKLFHLYDFGKLMNVYQFHNPKFLTMNLDDLDMSESGTGSEIEFQFAYDALHITPSERVIDNPQRLTDISGGNIGALYPIKPNFLPNDPAPSTEGVDGDGLPPRPESTNILSSAFSTVSDFAGSIFTG